jgi:hypothetical protein
MNIQKHYDSVYKFNDIAGNLANVDVSSVEAQIKIIKEEVEELDYALGSENATELLDGACDAFVTVVGLLQKMEKAGFKIDEALQIVNDNNLSKFPKNVSNAELDAYTWNQWSVKYNKEYDCYILKDDNDKIRKPAGFKSVDLMDCLPNDFFGWNERFGGKNV